jgi:Putative translation factor (SUA5)
MKLRLPSAVLVRRIRAHLRAGGVIAYPTESCYGLGCDPRNRRAVARLLALKQRPVFKGLILIADRFLRLAGLVAPLTPQQQTRVAATWPGPHTWLVPAGRRTPRWLTGSHPTLAVRVTAHPEAAGLCRALGMALVSTSANRSGQKPLRTARDCRRVFGEAVLTVPGTVGRRRRPSTIQDLLTGRILRP